MRPIDADALKNMRFSCAMHDDNFIVYVPMREVKENIDKAPTIGGWISVKDHMPERGTLCLVYDGIRICAARYITGNEWVHGLMMSIVTHWMLLPEPPEEAMS